MLTAFGYLRVSGKDQVDGDGFPRQREEITRWAATNDYRIVKWFPEKAMPGKTEWDERPAWLDMISQMNGVRAVLVERLDRLARDLMVQEHIIADLRRREITLISAAEPDLCVDDPSRKLLRQIMGAIAEYDRAMVTAKLAGARKRKKLSTGRCEGRKPYGHNDGENAIDLMKSLRAEGYTYRQIAERLTRDGIPARSAASWDQATVWKLLKRA